MVAIISHSVIDGLVKNKDVRSGSVDSFSSTIDVHADQPAKHTADNKHDATPDACRFGLVDEGLRFDVIPPSHRSLTPEEHHLREALSSIVILDSAARPEVQALLDAYHGHLVDVGSHILEGLREAAPSQLAARVGDYNENLFYEMQDRDRSIPSIVGECGEANDSTDAALRREVESFEASIRESLRRNEIQYRGSFMRTERTMYQPAHVDYDYPLLRQHGHKLFLAFFPLTEEGTFLQLWQDPTRTNDEEKGPVEGTVVYVPYGNVLVVPSDTIHGGGFKRGGGGNLRFHLYIAVEDDDGAEEADGEEREGQMTLLDHPMNRYTEERDRRRELCERFVDAKGLEELVGVFFDA